MDTDPLPLLADLIRCPSVTPSEAGALDVLERYLSAAGFQCQRLVFSEKGTPDVDNLFARFGKGRPHLCFAGHIDVVPPGRLEDWSAPPFTAYQADGFLYGRGAADMKGSVAAFATAAADAVRAGTFTGSLSLLITGDEEGPALNGTAKVLAWMKEKGHIPDHCLVGEPTSTDRLGDTIKIGRRGSMSFDVSVSGVQGHVAYPHKADNPIPKLARLIDRLAAYKFDDGNDRFDPTTLAFTTVDVGNPAGNVIPGHANARFNIRYNTEHTRETLTTIVRDTCAGVEEELGGVFTIDAVNRADAFVTEPGAFVGVVLDAIEAETGVLAKLSTSGGTSDARFIKNYCPVLEFGPINATIHHVNERIAVADLRNLADIYRGIIEAYVGRAPG
ncbi:succinyl-diaminopimelate desuccinylase [Nordella sp. HKS 07]|uniref:succinyl-diaminopimelate desuccinylase n=1 Tax=Nordella sp. HKS 07 TaxID=2712222 RepID=UPI0013E147E6|nr:succinyl-diaminopimelate desuccinylase [Nordella sp. HKS 07]QIG49503.1 succinyl-diaminopimelate desuccinylase [Nordella sp. HKS 07]